MTESHLGLSYGDVYVLDYIRDDVGYATVPVGYDITRHKVRVADYIATHTILEFLLRDS